MGSRSNMKSSLPRSPYLYRPRPPSNLERIYAQDKYNPPSNPGYSKLRKDPGLDRFQVRGGDDLAKIYEKPSSGIDYARLAERSDRLGNMGSRARMHSSNSDRQSRLSGLAGVTGVTGAGGLGNTGNLTGHIGLATHELTQNRPGSNLRPMTPTRQFLEKAGKDEYYQRQLNHNIMSKMSKQMKSLPTFPHLEDGASMASEQFGRPTSFRPGSASNPDFMLPRDVQFYSNNQDKIFSKLESFYDSEKRSIEEMMDECLKRIITVFEDHKQNLFTTLQEDKSTFSQIYGRFREGVNRFRKLAEDRLEENLKEYETRVQKIRENEQNPMETEIERLRLNKEMINSKEGIIREIKHSYEQSNIPRDKQSIGLLMIDEFKKKHELNVSTMAQHLQQIIGSLKSSIESFHAFQTYNNLNKPAPKAFDSGIKQDQMRASGKVYGEPQNTGMVGIPPGYMDQAMATATLSQMKASGMSHQMMMNNLAQMGLAQGVMPNNVMPNTEAYQMAMWKQQMRASKDVSEGKYDPALSSGTSPNLIGKNYEGPVFRPQINGNFNLNINAAHGNQSKWTPDLTRGKANSRTKSPRTHLEKLNSTLQGNALRPALKSAEKKMMDMEQAEGRNQMQSKKSVTFSIPNTDRSKSETEIGQEILPREELKRNREQNRSIDTKDRKRDLYSGQSRENEAGELGANKGLGSGRRLTQDEEIDQVISKYKNNNLQTSLEKRREKSGFAINQKDSEDRKSPLTPIPKQERAKSPILEAKESIQKLNSYYNQMKHQVPTYRQEKEDSSSFQHLRSKRGLNALRRTDRDTSARINGSPSGGLLGYQQNSKTAGNTPVKDREEKEAFSMPSEFGSTGRFGKLSKLGSQLKSKNSYQKKPGYGLGSYQDLKAKRRESDKKIVDPNQLGEYKMPEGLTSLGNRAPPAKEIREAKVNRFSREMLKPKSKIGKRAPKREIRNSIPYPVRGKSEARDSTFITGNTEGMNSE